MRKWFILFIIALFPLVSSADEWGIEANGLWYNLHDATETSSAYAEVISPQNGNSYTGAIVIPANVTYNEVTYPVTSIGSSAFSNTEITKVEIPSSITSIGSSAFYWCYNLVSVISKIEEPFAIDKNVFCSGTEWLNEVETVFPSGIIIYVPTGSLSKYQALEGWNMVMAILEGDMKEGIDGDLKYAYATGSRVATVIKGDNYSRFEKVVIPATATIDGITYPVKYLGMNAFRECYSIQTVTFNEGLEGIGGFSFQSLNNTEFGSFPSTLRFIGNYAFYNCNRLSKVILPESCTYVGSCAFCWCNNVKRIELPHSLSLIGSSAFQHCSSLSAVVSHIPTPYAIKNNVFCMEERWDDASGSTVYTNSDATLYVPSGTKSSYEIFTGWNMFAEIVEGELKEATVDGLIYSYLESKGTASVIGRFDNEMYNITIPGSVTIGSANYTVKAVGPGAFWGGSGLGVGTVVIAEGVETIGKNAFRENSSLESVSLPSTLKTIGDYAFFYCEYNLRKIELPASLDSIGDYAFSRLRNLTTVISRIQRPFKINESVFSIDENWDYSGENPKQTFTKSPATLYVPDGTKTSYQSIAGWNMFADIVEGELKEATVDGLIYSYIEGKGVASVIGRANDDMRNITIPSSVPIGSAGYLVKSVGTGAFQSCGLDSLVINDGIETIGRDAFRENWNLKSVVFPSTLKTIGEYAFYNCEYNLRKIELPASLDSIGDYAFSRLRNLASVICRNQRPFNINESVFSIEENWDYSGESPKQTFTKSPATLYVPDGTKASYKSIDGWNMFAEIVEGELKEATVEGLIYSYLEGKSNATVIGRSDNEMYDINIPGSVPISGVNYTVNAVGPGAFSNCSLQSVVVGEGIKTIGKNAFRENWSLSSISLPSTLKTIGEYAFAYCEYQLKKIELPASIDSIGDYAFYYTRNLSTVISRIQSPFNISENVFCLGWDWDYSGETSKQVFTKSNANLFVPEGASGLYKKAKGWDMFSGMYEGDLMEAEVNGLKYTYLTSTMTASVISGNYSEMTSVTIPSTVDIEGNTYRVTEIGESAFRSCWSLETVEINDGVERIGDQAFMYCGNADFGTLPSSIRYIGYEAFFNCGFKNLEIPEGVTTINERAFASCGSLQKLILPQSLTSIGDYAFAFNNSLTIVTSHLHEPFAISKSVFCSNSGWNEEVGEYYESCPATLCVPEGTLSKYKTLEGWMMFGDYIEGELMIVTIDGLTYIINTSSRVASVTSGDNYMGKITVPSTVPFDGNTYNVKNISARAFANTSIVSMVIEDGVEIIGQEAFQHCQQMTSLTLPEKTLTKIEPRAFFNCDKLKSLLIPASVTSIGEYAFSSCKSLTSIVVAEGNTKYASLGSNAIIESGTNTLILGCSTTVIPGSVKTIGREAFFNSDITEITIPSSVESILSNAFGSCRYLKEVKLPEGVKIVEGSAFNTCERLETIEFPSTMEKFGEYMFSGSNNLQNVVCYNETPKEIYEDVFADSYVYERATLWVPKGKVDTYKKIGGWKNFKNYDEMLGDVLTKPTITYNGRYMTMTNDSTQRAKIYFSLDGSEPTILYGDTLTITNLGVIQAISKRFGSFTVDTAVYKVDYLFDGVTARIASGGLLKNAFEWCGTDKVESIDIDGTLNDDDFGTIRGLAKLKTLNMAASKMSNGIIPAEAFANTKLQWYVSPYTMTGVGANIFKGCDMLSAITWNSSIIELPDDVANDVANPNLLVYAKAQAMIPYALKNVIVNGVANSITLTDSTGNNNFVCPEPFLARRITYSHNYQQPTAIGRAQGWETIALPFTVDKIVHDTQGEIGPMSVDGVEKRFWLYELGDNGLEPASQIQANLPYLICMPNDDAYGDEYILGGRVTFSAKNVTITTSDGISVSSGDRQFVPTYQRVASSADVFALNVNQVVGDNPVGSVFVSSLREVRPFEAYSVHSSNKARIISLTSLGGGDVTGINDLMLKNTGKSADDVVRVYSLSGALIKQGKREDVLRSLPKGIYIINGKKIIK